MKEFKPKLDGAMGGEAWQHAPGQMPWDRPAQFPDPNQALNDVFNTISQPKQAKRLLNLLDQKTPIDFLAEQIIKSGFREGKFSATSVVNMAGPLTVMLWRMAETAGIRPVTSDDLKSESLKDFDPSDMAAAQARISNNTAEKAIGANTQSRKELSDPDLVDREGFIKFRPTAKGNA